MTDPSTPSAATEEPRGPTPTAQPRARSPYARERTAVGLVFFALVGFIVVNGAAQIHRDTFRVPAATRPVMSCSDEINRLFTAFAVLLLPVRAMPDNGLRPRRPSTERDTRDDLRRLDEHLLALRPYCRAEGDPALDAYDSLTLWRYQAQDLSRLEEGVLTPDAERALGYRSPQTTPPAPGTTSNDR